MPIFLPQEHYDMLNAVFANIQALPAEKHICNFTQDYQQFRQNLDIHEATMIRDYIRKKEQNPNLNFPKNKKGGSFILSNCHRKQK